MNKEIKKLRIFIYISILFSSLHIANASVVAQQNDSSSSWLYSDNSWLTQVAFNLASESEVCYADYYLDSNNDISYQSILDIRDLIGTQYEFRATSTITGTELLSMIPANTPGGCYTLPAGDYRAHVTRSSVLHSISYLGNSVGSAYLVLYDSDGGSVPITTTRIIDFNPQNDEVIDIGGMATGTVDFDIHAYINPEDLGDYLTIKIIFRNIDQNTLASGECGPLDFSLLCSTYTFDIFRGNATTSGDFYYASSTVLRAGNYRVEASLDTATTFLGLNLGFFTFLGSVSDVQNHQFIVGTSTFIGNLSQTIFEQTDSFFGSLPATTTAALAAQCNPLGGNFGIRECLAFLLVPDANQLKNTFEQFRNGVLVKAPWGYVTRFITIISASTTQSLPTISYNFGSVGPLAGVEWDIDPGDMIAGAGTLLDSVEDGNGNNIRDVLEPLVKLIVGMAVVFGIVTDLTGSHGHSVVQRDSKRT